MRRCLRCGYQNEDAADVCAECGAKMDAPSVEQDPSSREPPGLTRCGACGALIPQDSILCPKCGWAQPRLA